MKKLIYNWKACARVNLDANAVAAELKRIAGRDGDVSPAAVVREAKKKRSILHDFFEWDDSVAAKSYRLDQARYLIRSLEVTILPTEETLEKMVTVRQYVSLPKKGTGDGKTSKYHDIGKVTSDNLLRSQAVKKIWRELNAIRKKYEHFSEFNDIWKAMTRAEKKLLDKTG